MIKILIPAMEKRSALMAARSLGRKGFYVVGCSHTKNNSGFFSKYCHKSYTYHSPLKDINKYLDDIKHIIEKEKPAVFIPINEETLLPLLEDREYFEKKIKLCLPDNKTIEKALDKVESFKIAQSLNIPCPKMVDKDSKDIHFPIIARPKSSCRIEEGKMMSEGLAYIFSKKQLTNFPEEKFFFQEYIPGRGYGFYALFDRGEPKAYFMMKRINEVPFTGGPSSLREGYHDQRLEQYGLEILKKMRWHGAAMVEFRKDVRDNEFRFIEINPRFWGSLALSSASGVDFPYLLVRMAQGKRVKDNFDYQIGIRARWLFGDFSYLWSVLFGEKIDWRPSRSKALWEFLRFSEKDLHYDYFQTDDLAPAAAEILFSFAKLFKKII